MSPDSVLTLLTAFSKEFPSLSSFLLSPLRRWKLNDVNLPNISDHYECSRNHSLEINCKIKWGWRGMWTPELPFCSHAEGQRSAAPETQHTTTAGEIAQGSAHPKASIYPNLPRQGRNWSSQSRRQNSRIWSEQHRKVCSFLTEHVFLGFPNSFSAAVGIYNTWALQVERKRILDILWKEWGYPLGNKNMRKPLCCSYFSDERS